MSVAQTIEQSVRDNFDVEYLELLNESHQHAGPATESHFKLTVVAPDFEGLRLVQRHQKVYALTQELMQNGPLHALSLHLFTPEEWQKRGGTVADSPNCRGVGS
nr:putative regulator protein [uncultured bacterium]